MRIRVARPSRDLDRARRFYVDVLGLTDQGGFRGHAGYDGLFLSLPGGGQLELTCGGGAPMPTAAGDLLVLYLPSGGEVGAVAARLDEWGAPRVAPENPYWERHGITVLDPDGYRLVVAVAD